jgi:hypothetical protein
MNRWRIPSRQCYIAAASLASALLWLGLEWREEPGLTPRALALELLELVLLVVVAASIALLALARRRRRDGE